MLPAKQVNEVIQLMREHDELTGRFHAIDTSLWMSALMGLGPVYIPKNFQSHEFLPPEIHKVFEDRGYKFMDNRILWTMDAIREYFGKPVYVNNWYWGGDSIARGLRQFDSPVGAALSQHKFGRACDFTVKDVDSEIVRQTILKGKSEQDAHFMYITALELGTPHVHIDCRNTGKSDIFTFHP